MQSRPKRGMPYFTSYRRAVEDAGGEPADLFPGTEVLPELDSLLLPGGWDVDPSSEFGHATGEETIRINSLHHQAVGTLAPGLRPTARGRTARSKASSQTMAWSSRRSAIRNS